MVDVSETEQLIAALETVARATLEAAGYVDKGYIVTDDNRYRVRASVDRCIMGLHGLRRAVIKETDPPWKPSFWPRPPQP